MTLSRSLRYLVAPAKAVVAITAFTAFFVLNLVLDVASREVRR